MFTIDTEQREHQHVDKTRPYLHMRIRWLSPPPLLQGYLPHPPDASPRPLMACRHAHMSVLLHCLNLLSCTFPWLIASLP